MARVQTLSPIQIVTNYERPVLDPGMAGVMLLVAGNAETFQSYTSIQSVINDYQPGTAVYDQADAYFGNANSPLFQVLTYKQGDTTSLTNQITKYYYAGAQYFLFHSVVDTLSGSDVTNVQTAVSTISNFVEQQDNKEVVFDFPYSDESKMADFVKATNIAGNKATFTVAKPLVNGKDEYFGAHFLADYANAKLGKSATFVNQLKGVTPQDKYEFGVSDVEKYFKPNHIATYAYRAGTPMLTSGVTQSGDQLQAIVIRDAITKRVSASLNNLFLQNDGRITYDDAGISLFNSTIYAELKDFADKDYIDPNFTITAVKASDVSDSKKASGVLTGMSYKYRPVNTIDSATLSQTVVLPQVEG